LPSGYAYLTRDSSFEWQSWLSIDHAKTKTLHYSSLLQFANGRYRHIDVIAPPSKAPKSTLEESPLINVLLYPCPDVDARQK
jgi:hypothetical protein